MSPVALNTVAILIFSITMLSILSPVLHLSPWVPAGVTLGLLGLVTLDTLQLRGQGVTLLLNAIARRSPAYQQQVVRHEAGHFLVAQLLGIPVTHYALTAWDAFRQGQVAQGGVGFDEQVIEADLRQLQGRTLTPDQLQILNRYAIVWMAGIAAEELSAPQGTVEAIGGSEDRAKLAQVFQRFGYSPQGIKTQERWAILQARSFLSQHQSTYDALCVAMAENQPVETCQAIIQSHTAAPLAAHEP